MKYRVYEVVNNNHDACKEHGHFEFLEHAQDYASKRYHLKPKSTFVVNYTMDDGRVVEQYYGKYTN